MLDVLNKYFGEYVDSIQVINKEDCVQFRFKKSDKEHCVTVTEQFDPNGWGMVSLMQTCEDAVRDVQ